VDHNVWNYLFFIQHLQTKEECDHNGIESVVYAKIKNKDNTWFPVTECIRANRAMKELTGDTEKENQNEVIYDKMDQGLSRLDDK